MSEQTHDARAKNSRSIIISGPATARAAQLAVEVDQLVVRISTAATSRFSEERNASLEAETLIADAQRSFSDVVRRARQLLDTARHKGAARANNRNRPTTPAAPAKQPKKPNGAGNGKPVPVAKKTAPAKPKQNASKPQPDQAAAPTQSA